MLPLWKCPQTGCNAMTSLPATSSDSLPFYNTQEVPVGVPFGPAFEFQQESITQLPQTQERMP